MRKIIITESQFKRILEESGYPLNTSDGSDINGNAYGTEVFAGNIDKDAKYSSIDTDKISTKKCRNNRFFARTRVYEDLDDEKVSGFGMKSDNQIKSQAANGGGKMIKNIADRIENGGQKLNTTEKELSRLKNDKKENPIRYQQNGGDNTLKTLEKTAKQQRSIASVRREADNNIKSIMNNPLTQTPNQNKGTGKGHHSENEGNIYYY